MAAQSPNDADPADSPAVAFVLVERAAKPRPDAVIDAASKLGIDLHLTGPSQAGHSFEADAGVAVQVMPMGFPHPDAQRARIAGPTAVKSVDAQAATDHIMIVTQGLTGPPRVRDGFLAAVTAAVIDTVPAVGAMLGHGAIFHKARLFRDAVAGAPRGSIPPLIAVDISMAREGDAQMSFLTHGMPRYGRENLHVTCAVTAGNNAAQFTMGLVRWMLTDPTKHFPTGDTVGRTASERIRVQRVPHPFRAGEVVMRLDLG